MDQRRGLMYGIAAYLCWGAFPLFFMLLAAVDPLEIVPWRVITALVFCILVLAVMRQWAALGAILRSPRRFWWFVLATVLLYINWQLFVIGVVTGHIIETALGYFMNPFVSIVVGVFVRREKLRPTQWAAVGVAALGVVIAAIAYGQFPWIALGLAFSFGFYGVVRKQATSDIDALSGLTVETLIATPISILQLVVVALIGGGLHAFDHGGLVTFALLMSGIVTAIPLLLFGAANRRMALSHMGFLQFSTPILSFLTGWLLFREEMPPARWIGFVAVWIAVAILLWDMIHHLTRRNAAPAPALD